MLFNVLDGMHAKDKILRNSVNGELFWGTETDILELMIRLHMSILDFCWRGCLTTK